MVKKSEQITRSCAESKATKPLRPFAAKLQNVNVTPSNSSDSHRKRPNFMSTPPKIARMILVAFSSKTAQGRAIDRRGFARYQSLRIFLPFHSRWHEIERALISTP
jgi:hypothetical protein